MIRIGFWGPLYYNYNKEPPLIRTVDRCRKMHSTRQYCEMLSLTPLRPTPWQTKTLKPTMSIQTGLLSNQGGKSINFYFILVPLRKKVSKYGTLKPSKALSTLGAFF